jgi:hypothetical protein
MRACDTLARRANQSAFRLAKEMNVNEQSPVRGAKTGTRSRILDAAQHDWEPATWRIRTIRWLALAMTVTRQRLLFPGFLPDSAPRSDDDLGSPNWHDGPFGCGFPVPIAQKHWKNRGRRLKIAKNPEKNCVEASSLAQGSL